MNHSKDDVIPAAAPLWRQIITDLCSVDDAMFNGRHQPCKLCGGTDRARFIEKHNAQFHCNVCGDKDGLNFYMEFMGISFGDAINDIGNWLNLIPMDKREEIKREFKITSQFSKWYKFDINQYEKIKSESELVINPWQRINGLQMIDMYSYENKSAFPLLNEHGKDVDAVLVDIDGNWLTSAGNSMLHNGLYSVFGSEIGNYTYLTVKPLVAAKSHVFTGKQVVCTWEEENIFHVGIKYDFNVVVIVSNLSEVENADSLNLNQMIFDPKTNKVKNKIYLPYEIVAMRNA